MPFLYHLLALYFILISPLTSSNSDLSVWCFSYDAYLDAQLIPQLRPVYQLAYILKFGEPPPLLPSDQHHLPSATSLQS
uniref:Secreted protein n=1 Tax=Cajanus cajan TaxID=3821 RepID=A0A151TPD0_CAJCA|nr:hypothetical protein KK1_022492 [Cajanus cajan]